MSVDRYVFLGDVVGAGPNPIQCCSWVLEGCEWCLAGYWDRCLGDPSGLEFSSAVHTNEMLRWCRDVLLGVESGRGQVERVAGHPHSHREAGSMFVYGSVRSPDIGYLPIAPPSPGDAAREYAALPDDVGVCFSGRLGHPCLVRPDGTVEHAKLLGYGVAIPIPDPLIVSVGSVGLPRDNDPRACYVIADGDTIMFRRTGYDIEELVSSFEAEDALSPECRKWMIGRHREGV
jgi:hypothetical protein